MKENIIQPIILLLILLGLAKCIQYVVILFFETLLYLINKPIQSFIILTFIFLVGYLINKIIYRK